MNYKDFSNLEDQIMNTVKTAVNAIDFVNIKSEITERAEDTLQDVKMKIKEYNDSLETKHKKLIPKNNLRYVSKKPVGIASGIISIIFGGIGILFFMLVALGLTLSFSASGNLNQLRDIILIIIALVFLSGNVVLLFNGLSSIKRVSRFKKYVKFLDDDSFFLIKDLAKYMNEKERFIVKELRQMIKKNMFLEGCIDDEENYFLLTREVYKNYLDLKKRQLEEAKSGKQKMNKKEEAKEQVKDEEYDKVKSIIKSGRTSIDQIRNIERDIRKEEMSIKLNKMQGIVHQILNYIEKNPKKINEVNKFINHYLPITIKLLNSYKDLNNQPLQGENIKNAKMEIEHSIDVVNMAFENLLDDLFEDMAMDISTDISVLKTLFKQEGLTEENDFGNKN